MHSTLPFAIFLVFAGATLVQLLLWWAGLPACFPAAGITAGGEAGGQRSTTAAFRADLRLEKSRP
ncbi:MAG: hypothetical protein EP344_16000 [Bacteroidetes bacterium]|nr:MAG: hypothetical protein EP344_16000 [Bacteroidota bacterium]